MVTFQKKNLLYKFLSQIPTLLLLISVLNEFDFNYLELKYFSFNFPFILIFYWSLKKSESLGYGIIFIAGLINDAVVGFPLGISSLAYLLICGFAAYLRNITLRPQIIKDWAFFSLTIMIVNSIIYSLLFLFFSFDFNYNDLLVNFLFTFLFYLIFSVIFTSYTKLFFGSSND